MLTMCTLRTPIAKPTMKLSMFICRSKMRKMDAVMTKNANVSRIIILLVHTFLPLEENHTTAIRDQVHGVKVSKNGFHLYEKEYAYDNKN